MRADPLTTVVCRDHITSDTSGLGDMLRTGGSVSWEAVPGSLVYYLPIDRPAHYSEIGNLVFGLISMCCLCWPSSSEHPQPAKEQGKSCCVHFKWVFLKGMSWLARHFSDRAHHAPAWQGWFCFGLVAS